MRDHDDEVRDGMMRLSQAAGLMRGRYGRRPAADTLRRWANPRKGCRPAGADGPVIFLRVVRLGGELLTRAEWVAEFEAERLRMGMRVVSPPRGPKPAA